MNFFNLPTSNERFMIIHGYFFLINLSPPFIFPPAAHHQLPIISKRQRNNTAKHIQDHERHKSRYNIFFHLLFAGKKMFDGNVFHIFLQSPVSRLSMEEKKAARTHSPVRVHISIKEANTAEKKT